MRLLFVCPDMRTGGAERHWATLIPELHDRGIAVKLLALADTGPFFDDVAARGVPAECLGLQRHTNPRALRLALSVGAAFEPSAVVTRGVSGQLVGEAIAPALARRARVERAHAAHARRPARAAAATPARPHPAGGSQGRRRGCGHAAPGAAARAARIPAWADRRGAQRGVRTRRAGSRGVTRARRRVLRAVRVGTAGGRSGWTCSSRRSQRRGATTRRSTAMWPVMGRNASSSSGSRRTME